MREIRPPLQAKSLARVVGLMLAAALLNGCSERSPSIERHTYTGIVVAICSHTTDGRPDCFAMEPDAGTAYRDGYYAGGGAVSFGRPPVGVHIPRMGDHLTVTVVMEPNRTWVAGIAPAAPA
jgi:hypothetical protein